MTYEIASLAISLAIGLGQIGILWVGIRAMNRSSDERARARAQAAKLADQRHAETMAALEMQRQAFETQHQALETQRGALEIQSRALETLIVRTAPAAE